MCAATAAQRCHFEQQLWRGAGCGLAVGAACLQALRQAAACRVEWAVTAAGQRCGHFPGTFGQGRADGVLGAVAGCWLYMSPF